MCPAVAARIVELCDQGQEAIAIAIAELTAMANECNASIAAREARLAMLLAKEGRRASDHDDTAPGGHSVGKLGHTADDMKHTLKPAKGCHVSEISSEGSL